MIIGLSDVMNYMDRQIDGGRLAAASVICDTVQRDLEDGYLGRRLEVESHTESIPLYPTDDNFIELTYTPLVSVSAISIDGAAQPNTAWALERSGVYVFTAYSFGLVWPSIVTVTYTAGLGDPALTVCKGVILARASRIIDKLMNDELGLEMIKIEGYMAKWLAEDDFTPGEQAVMQRWKRRGFSAAPQFAKPSGAGTSSPTVYDPFTRY